jgi:hypothetical protein
MANKEQQSRLDELQKQLDAAQGEKVEVAEQLASLPSAGDGSFKLPEGHLASEATDEEIERASILRDPWAGQDALAILRQPPGKMLQWVAPEYRKRRGLRGWTAVRYDDAIGREIHLYINDPPSRMQGMADLDPVVRRGDVVLAWIDKGIYDKRILEGQRKANKNLVGAVNAGERQVGRFGKITGEGLQDDPNSKYRRKRAPGMVSPRSTADYRDRAQGTFEDPRIRVEGRRLFSEPEPQE